MEVVGIVLCSFNKVMGIATLTIVVHESIALSWVERTVCKGGGNNRGKTNHTCTKMGRK